MGFIWSSRSDNMIGVPRAEARSLGFVSILSVGEDGFGGSGLGGVGLINLLGVVGDVCLIRKARSITEMHAGVLVTQVADMILSPLRSLTARNFQATGFFLTKEIWEEVLLSVRGCTELPHNVKLLSCNKICKIYSINSWVFGKTFKSYHRDISNQSEFPELKKYIYTEQITQDNQPSTSQRCQTKL